MASKFPRTLQLGRAMAATVALFLAASSPTIARAQASDTGMDAVLDALDNARNFVLSETPGGDGVERAQGYRYTLRLIEFLLADRTDDHDPTTPTVARCPSKLCKTGFDNPDTAYLSVGPLNGNLSYRVSGHRGSVTYITYQIFELSAQGFSTGDILESADLVLAEDGSYEIVLGAQNVTGAPNFMEIGTTGMSSLIIRQLHHDWNQEVESSVAVELLFPVPVPFSAPIFGPAELAQGGSILGSQLESFITLFRQLYNFQLQTNVLPEPTPGSLGSGGGFPSNFTTRGKYSIAADEALLIEVRNSATVYQNIQLANSWLESLDYGTRQTSLNGGQEYVDSDGVRRFVVATSDPGVPNWLDATGHNEGAIFMRFQSPPADDLPDTPIVTVVPLADLRDFLPADHPTLTSAERAQVLRDRLQGYNMRKNPANIASFRDADGDGEHDSGDLCPGTADGELADTAGCSHAQFCAGFDGSPQECRKADFLNDEPTAGNPKDCRPVQGGPVCEVF